VPNPPNHRLFIAQQNRVMMVDEDKGTLLAEVTGIQGVYETAIAVRTYPVNQYLSIPFGYQSRRQLFLEVELTLTDLMRSL